MEMTIEKIFNNWIEGSNSNNTKKQYIRIIPQFFQMTSGKDLADLTEDDIQELSPVLIDTKYKKELLNEGKKNSTIINYLKIVSSFFRQLEINRLFPSLNYSWIKEVLLSSSRLKDDSETRKKMSVKNYQDFLEWLVNKPFSNRYADKGVKYALVLEFMWVTASRIDATFNVKWEDISYEADGVGQYGYTVYVHDKGGKVNAKPISDEFYLKLESMLDCPEQNTKIFDGLSKQNFTKLTKEFCEVSGNDFTPHSIKKGAVTHLYGITKDIVLTQRFADHEDPKTTFRYIQEDPDRTTQGSFILSSDLDTSCINSLSKEELLGIIMSRKDLSFGVLQELKKSSENIDLTVKS